MNKIYLLLIACLVSVVSRAQVTGTKTIGTDYATLSAAISALNTGGISGAVTVNIPANYTETAPAGGYVLGSSTLNASMSSTNTLTIRKSGAGSNPLLTAPVGTTTTNDGIFIIQGTDYVTIDGISLTESGSNPTSTEQMEWGYALVKLNGTAPFDGCNTVVIKNCSISLNVNNPGCAAIYSGTHTATSTTMLDITATSDATNNCRFESNTFTNVNRGVVLNGYTTAVSPYSLYDQNNSIGGTTAALGNSITFGGGATSNAFAIQIAGANNTLASNNTITSSSTPGTGQIVAIMHGIGFNSTFTASYNTIQITASTGAVFGIINGGTGSANSGVCGTSGVFNAIGNTFQNYTFTTTNTQTNVLCVYNYGGTSAGWDLGTLNIKNNTVSNFNLNASGTHYLFYNYYCNSNDVRYNGNRVSGVRRTGTSGTTYVWSNYYGNPTSGADSVVDNRVSDCSAPWSLFCYYDNACCAQGGRARVMMRDTVMNDSAALGSTFYYLYGMYAYYLGNLTMTNNYVANNWSNPNNYGYIYGYYMYGQSAQTISNNTYINNTAYYHYGFYSSGATGPVQMNNNRIDNLTGSTLGGGCYLFCAGSSGAVNCYNNVAKNITMPGSVSIYGLYNTSAGTTSSFYNDTLYNINYTGTGGSLYGMYSGSSSAVVNFYNNHIGRVTNAGTSGTMYSGLYGISGTTVNYYNNLIDSIAVTGTSSVNLYGIYWSNSTGTLNCYKNKLSGFSNATTSGTIYCTPMYILSGTTNIYNNLIGDIRTPGSANTSFYVSGIYISGGTAHNLSFNTVLMNNPSSTGANFGSNALYASTTPNLTLRNNVFVNTSVQNGTGYACAYRRSSSTLTSYQSASNNNLFYAGTPGTYRLIYYDVTNANQTLANYKSLVTPRDANSITENVTFQATGGIATTFLRPSTTVATQIESGGPNITGITDDTWGVTRAGNTGYSGTGVSPDLGAVEDNYTPNDQAAPNVAYTPLPFTCGTGDRTFTAVITDITGVPTTGTLRPRVYYKKGAGSWYSSTGTLTTGTATSGTWTFTIVASDMGGIALSDVISYFVIAQDINTTPNVGSTPGGVAATDVNTITTYPAAPNSYSINPSLSGTYTVGSGGDYATLTNAVNTYNGACLTGPVTFSLISSTYPSETFPIIINVNPYASSTNFLTIKPAATVYPTISGSVASSAIIKLNGADNVVIDGSNTSGGTTKDLTLNNTYTSTSAVIWNASLGGSGNGANNNTIKNVNVVAGANTTSNVYGIISCNGTSIPTAGDNNNYLTIQNCNIQKAYYGIYLNGTASLPHTGCLITQDSIGSTTAANYVLFYGVWLANQSTPTVSKNTIFNMKNTTLTNIAGIEVGANVADGVIEKNNLTGIYQESTGGWGAYGIDITGAGCTNLAIRNNFISDMRTENYSSSSTTYNAFGIRAAASTTNLKIYYNSISFYGTVPVGSSPGMSSCILFTTSQTGLEMKDNILSNTQTFVGSGSLTYDVYLSTGVSFATSNYNDYYGASGTNTTFYTAYTSGTNRSLLSDWQTYTGQDANSINNQPIFVSSNDLHLQVAGENVPFVAGNAITGITTDIDGTTRSGTLPVIGAHEVNIPACTTVTAGTPTPVTNTFCGSGTTLINGTGVTAAMNMQYQWKSSTDGVTFTPIAGATSTNYTIPTISSTTYYKLVARCTLTSNADSATTTVTINPNPVAISGTPGVCVGSNTTISDATVGGTWTSSNTAAVTIGSASGVLGGVAAGTSNITYQLTATGCRTTTIATAYALPSAVTVTPSPSATVCFGNGATFTANATAPASAPPVTIVSQNFNVGMTGAIGGTWSIVNIAGTSGSYWQLRTSPGYSSITPGDGTQMMEAAPDATGSGVNTTTQVYSPVFSLAGFSAATLKFNQYCYSSTSYDAVVAIEYSTNGGSTWNVLSSQLGSIIGSSTWSAGTPTTTLTMPAAALGQPTVQLRWHYNSTWGYEWAIDNVIVEGVAPPTFTWNGIAGASGLACTTCGTNTLTPTALGANTYTVVATANGCSTGTSVNVSVNPLPATAAGSTQVCFGLTGTLTDATPGGTWTSGNAAIASVGASTGAVTGNAVGTANVSYTLSSTGCRSTKVVTVNPLPADITGTAAACVGATTNLSDPTAAGTWSSGTTAIATVGMADGVVSGASAGLAIITYMLPTGCIKTVEATINPLPVTTITPATVATVCQGDGTNFTAFAPQPSFAILLQDFNSGLGTWNIINTSGTTASYWQPVTATYSGATGDGSQMLEAAADATGGAPTTTELRSPAFSTLGYGSATLSFNQYLISLASSDANVDVQYSTDNGFTWNTVISQVGTVSGSGSWSSTSTPEVSVDLPAGALGQPSVKLRWYYNSNWGLYWDIDNIKVTAYQPPVSYVWTGVSGATGLSCAACGTTTITPGATGTNLYSVTSTTSSGCTSTNGVTVNVNPLPSVITGTMQVCVNSTTTMANADAGGTWSSADATVSVDATTGAVTGVSAGTALVTYTLPTGCRNTTVITVNALPATTTGVLQVCEGLTTTLDNSTGGGSWSSSFPSVADVDASGVVSGFVAGVADIYYTLSSTGCRIAANVTVNPTPQPITGVMQVCEASTTALSDADAGGTWASGTTSVATVDATTGVVTGVVAGGSVITYQLPTGCINTATVTVNAVPATITGSLQVCQSLTTALSNATTGGTWSTASADASVDAMGVVTGINAGVATVTYQLATSCISTANVTVNPTPAAIGGTPQVCIGLTTALTNADGGGTWASGSTGIATVDATTGVVTGLITGTSTITYQLPTGCINTQNVTVDPTPAAITGIRQVCEGLTTTLSNTDPGGAWSTGAFNVSVDASGIVTAYTAGVATITYQLPTGCINTADVTVNPLPAAISGSNQVCEGLTAALVNSTGGGSWSSSVPTVASIDAGGTVYAIAAGNTRITYTLSGTGCINTMDMTVNPAPAAITGTTQVCEASTTNLASATTGGTWSSGAFMTASVDATGIVSGISAGTAAITYMLATGCQATAQVTVNPLPATITGTKVVCENANTTLYNTSSGGAWTSGATGTATVASGTGVVTGVTAGNANITYTLPTGCLTNTQVTVNPNPTAIAGTPQVCAGLTTALSSTSTGGTWTSSLPAVASVTGSTGVVTGVAMGNARITYTLPTSCKTTVMVTVNPLPAPIAGTGQVCAGSIGTLTNGSAGGTWNSSTSAVATVDAAGNVNAIAAGTTLVTYTLPTGCIRTRTVVVNPLPAAISGTMQLCQTATTALSDATAGGAWSSSAVTTASISSAGLVNGGMPGTATITYTLPTGCKAMDVVTVNQIPSAIAGTPSACQGSTTALSNTVGGGTWASSVTTVATIDGTTGVVNGLTAGSTVITYELPTGCKATRTILINPQPAAIVGTPQVCYGATTTFSNAVSGGIWSTSNTAVANAGLTSGVVTGLAAGTVTVSYTLMTGCAVSTAVVVDPLPAAITGSLNVCNGQTSALGSTTGGGTWTSSNPAIANVSTTGVVSGMTPGNAVVTYALATGCKRASIVTVNALPVAQSVVGGGNYCTGGAGVHIGLSGSNSGINYQLYNGTVPSGTPVTGITGLPLDFGLVMPAGTYSVVARNAATGCASDMTGSVDIVVNPVLVTALSIVTPSDVVCEGSTPLYTASIVNGGTTPTYQWKVNGTPIPGATNATYTYTPGNGDVVTSMVTSSAPCAFPANASASRTMTVNANEMPVASVVTTSGPALCDGNTATFNVSSLYGGTSPAFTWLKNGAVAGTGATFAYVPANGDNISVKMNSNYSCRLADSVTSPAVTMMTSPVYIPAITITSNHGFFVNENTNVTLTATVASGGPAPVYQWSLNGATVAGATSATYSKVFNNGDSVSCQVTGSGLCGMSAFNSVVMRVGPTSVATTSVGNMNVQLMPNPNKGEFSVKGSLTVKEDKEVAIEVTNMLGQVVYRTNVIARNGEVDTRIKLDNTLANGMYMLNMISDEDRKVFHFVLEQ